MAATLIMRIITGSIRREGDEPSSVLPRWSPVRIDTETPVVCDGVAGIRMPPSGSDHSLHAMETGRGVPMVAVSVRPPGKV